MSKSKYNVVEVFWRAGGFDLLIIELPEEKALTKLKAMGEVRTISKTEYYNFLLTNCLVDIETLANYMASASSEEILDMVLVDEVASLIIEANPILNPSLLVVDKDGFIVPLSGDETSSKVLVNNPRWNDSISEMLIEMDQGAEGLPPDEGVTMMMWDTVGFEIPVIQLEDDPKVTKEFFSQRNKFVNINGYKAYVMQNGIYDFSSLSFRLDGLGVFAENTHIEVFNQLYAIIIKVNPQLSLRNIDSSIVTITSGVPSSGKKTRRDRTSSGSKPVAATAETEELTQKEDSKDFSSVSTEELLALPDRVNKILVGQTEAVERICETIQIAGAGLRSPDKPLATFLLAGETGVGKSYCAKVLSEVLTGSRDIVRIDCSEYGQAHEVSKLMGAPPGYVSHEAGGQLTNKIIESPFSVVLFDEIEKAHSKLFDILLQLLDEGRMTDGKGVTADFSDCVILLTSNIGVNSVSRIKKTVGFGEVASITHEKRTDAIEKAIRRKFKPEFINRLDGILTFNALGKPECKKILRLSFEEVSGFLKNKDITLNPSEAVYSFLLDKGFSAEYGARALKRTIESLVIRPLALRVLKEKHLEGCEINIGIDKNEKITFDFKAKPKITLVEVDVAELFNEESK